MGLFSNIRKFFIREKELGYLSDDDIGMGGYLDGFWADGKYLNAYGKSLYVYACVSKIAEKVAATNFRLFRIINSDGETEEIKNHEILDLLYKVNPFYTKTEFIETDVINRKLTGDSFILKIRNNEGGVAELWNIRPDLVTIKTDPVDYIKEYRIRKEDGTEAVIPPEDMIHIKYPSPLDNFLGLSPLSGIKARMEIEEYASTYQKNSFINNSRPSAVIESDIMTPSQAKELEEKWNAKHKGARSNSKLGILWGGAKYHQLNLTPQEMSYIESIKVTRDDILMAFKVPKPIVAITDEVNYANAKTAQEVFLSETIIPEIKRFVEKINEQLVIPDYGEEYFIDFIDPVPVNRETRLQELDKGIDRWITINEARYEVGLEPIEGGDVLLRPLSMSPIAELGGFGLESEEYKNLHGKRTLKYKLKLKEEVREALSEFKQDVKESGLKRLKKKDISERSLFKNPEKRKQYWEYRMKDIDKKSERLRALVIRMANEQKDRFIKKYRKEKPQTKSAIRKLFNQKAENQIFKTAIMPLFISIFKESGEDTMALLTIDKPFDIKKTNIGDYIMTLLGRRAMFFANAVNDTTLLGLTSTLAEGIAAGEGITKLQDRIIDAYKDFSDYRAEMIARTETNAVVNEAHIEAYKQSDADGKEWLATLDDRVRDEHREMNGEIVPVNRPFSNGLQYPSEPNCRCTTAPIFKIL